MPSNSDSKGDICPLSAIEVTRQEDLYLRQKEKPHGPGLTPDRGVAERADFLRDSV